MSRVDFINEYKNDAWMTIDNGHTQLNNSKNEYNVYTYKINNNIIPQKVFCLQKRNKL